MKLFNKKKQCLQLEQERDRLKAIIFQQDAAILKLRSENWGLLVKIAIHNIIAKGREDT